MHSSDDRLKIFIDDRDGSLYSKLDDNLKTTFEKMVLILLDKVLPFMPMFMRYFTDHGASHSKQVAWIMDRLIVNISPPINPDEAFILLASAWLHDIGMLHNIDPETGGELSEDKIRNMHAELSAKFIEKHKDKLFYGLDSSITVSIQIVCKNHTTDVDKWNSPENDFEEYGYRNRLLISILRLADILDLRQDRAPEILGETIKFPDISALHWEIYRTINIQKESISSYLDKYTNKNRVRIVIPAIAGQENEILMTSLYYYVIKEINDELERVRPFFEVAGVFLPKDVTPNLRTGDGQKKSIEGTQKSSKDLFNESKNLFAYSEFRKLEDKTKNPFILFDYCLNTAETFAKIKNADIQIEWRKKAQTYAGRIRDEFPPTSYFLTRIMYNELYLEKLRKKDFDYILEIEKRVSERQSLREIDLKEKFLYGMFPVGLKTEADPQEEKINILKSLNYLKGIINTAYSDLFTFKMTLFQYGFTTINEEILRSVVDIVKHRITQPDSNQKSQFKSLHNECCLCTGQALSILSYFVGLDMDKILPEKYITRGYILDDIEKIFKWIGIQQDNGFSKLNGKRVLRSFSASCAVMQGLLDLYFFNSRKKILQGIDNTEIKALIDQVKIELLKAFEYQQIKKNQKDKFYPITSDFYEYLAVAQYYSQIFADSSFFHRIELGDWVDEIFSIQDRCFLDRIYGCVHPFLLEKCAPGDEKEKLTEIAGNYIDELIRKNYEWRSNGSLNHNAKLTDRALRIWLKYWEHHWRREEVKTHRKV